MFNFTMFFHGWSFIFMVEINPFLPQFFNLKTWTPKIVEWHKIQQKTCFVSNDIGPSSFSLKRTLGANFQSHEAQKISSCCNVASCWLNLKASLVILDLPIDEKPTTTVVDEGISP